MKKTPLYSISFLILSLLASFINAGCVNKMNKSNDHGASIDTLKVVTIYGPLSYFNYRGEEMGIDYENVRRFAEEHDMFLEIRTVNNITDLLDELKNGKAHLGAYPIPSIAEYKEGVIYCGPIEINRQVLVQRSGKNSIQDVTELIGKDVYVEGNSKFHYRLQNLNEELGGGINIIPVTNDTISSEDFLPMVNSGLIEFAVVDSDIASLYQGAFPNLDVSLRLSADQASSWAVAPDLDSLAVKIDNWEKLTHSSQVIRDIYKNYYDRTISGEYDAKLPYFKKLELDKGKPVSSYDSSFKKYAPTAGYDWKLLAAIAYCESNFNPNVASRFGAYGLMQVMPQTAQSVGIEPGSLGNPDLNILAASKILARLDKSFQEKVKDPEERMKFVIASYNSGLGHIFDSMAIAEKIGMDPQKWTGNVSITALMKARPEFYNDPVVKHGYFRGRETVDFVDHVMSIYNYLQEEIKS